MFFVQSAPNLKDAPLLLALRSLRLLKAAVALRQHLLPRAPLSHHLVDSAPVGQTPYVAVVDEEVRFQLARERLVLPPLLRVVAVHGVELHAPLPAQLHRLVQQCTLPHAPQYQLVAVAYQHTQCLCGERQLPADGRVFVLHDSAVEVNCYNHFYFLRFIESSFLLP